MRQDDDSGNEAQEPLIAGEVHGARLYDGEHADPGLVSQLSLRDAGPIVQFLTLSAGISGLLFGFDTGVISSTLVSIGSDLSNRPLTTPDKSVVTAITSLLALIFAPTTGFFADKYGRKSVILFPALLFVLGALIQALASYVWTMVAGRALVGAAVGVASGAVPLYITELAPAELRGRLVTVQSLFITGGQVVAYLIGYLFAHFPHGWRWMVGLGAVPAVVQLFLLIRMPETPRWLLQTGKDEQARDVLMKVYAGLAERERSQAVDSILLSVRSEIRAEDKIHHSDGSRSGMVSTSAAKDLFAVPGNRRALTIACMLQGLQQLCGFNSLMYFSATIFSLVGFNSPIGTSLSIALTNFLLTCLAFNLIDTTGRRAILLRSIPWMVLGLALCSISFLYIHIGDAQSFTSYSGSSGLWSYILLLSMILYVAAYAVGLGCVPWQQSELFPLRVRSLGSGFATTMNWGSNFVIGMTFLPMMNVLGASVTFAVYAVICVLGWICILNVYPETAGLELEDIGELLKDGYNVKKSVIAFREKQRELDERHADSDDLER